MNTEWGRVRWRSRIVERMNQWSSHMLSWLHTYIHTMITWWSWGEVIKKKKTRWGKVDFCRVSYSKFIIWCLCIRYWILYKELFKTWEHGKEHEQYYTNFYKLHCYIYIIIVLLQEEKTGAKCVASLWWNSVFK